MRGVKTKSSGKWKTFSVFVALSLLLLVLLNSVHNVYKKKKEAEDALTRMYNDMNALKDREARLTNSIQKLSTQEGLEFEIKKKLNVAQAGESVALIVEENPASSSKPISNLSAWQKVKNFFSNLFSG